MITTLTLMLLGEMVSTTVSPPQPAAWEAVVSLGWVAANERLKIDAPGVVAQEDRWLSTYQLSLGVAARQLALFEEGDLQLAGWLGLGLRPGPGDPIASLGTEGLWRPLRYDPFSLGIGLRGQLWVDTAELSSSGFGLGVPLAIRLGPVELVYTFGLTIPLGQVERPVLGGVSEQGLATGLAPVDLSLRFYFDAEPDR